jgi:catechol 2,3-dioxygenase
MLETTKPIYRAAIHAAAQIDLAALAVGELERSVAFYTQAVGLSILQQGNTHVTLGTGETLLLVLREESRTVPRPPYTTGLTHLVFRVPRRNDLAAAVRRLNRCSCPIQGVADHLVSEAIYLTDPDGNGIAIAWDRPRRLWAWCHGQLRMGMFALDLQQLLTEQRDEPSAGPPQLTLGSMHLHVTNLEQAASFYCSTLGFDVMWQTSDALFVAAGGYHHHLGLFTWDRRDAPAPPQNAVGLRVFTLRLPDPTEQALVVARLQTAELAYQEYPYGVIVHDPWNHALLLTTATPVEVEQALAETLPFDRATDS